MKILYFIGIYLIVLFLLYTSSWFLYQRNGMLFFAMNVVTALVLMLIRSRLDYKKNSSSFVMFLIVLGLFTTVYVKGNVSRFLEHLNPWTNAIQIVGLFALSFWALIKGKRDVQN